MNDPYKGYILFTIEQWYVFNLATIWCESAGTQNLNSDRIFLKFIRISPQSLKNRRPTTVTWWQSKRKRDEMQFNDSLIAKETLLFHSIVHSFQWCAWAGILPARLGSPKKNSNHKNLLNPTRLGPSSKNCDSARLGSPNFFRYYVAKTFFPRTRWVQLDSARLAKKKFPIRLGLARRKNCSIRPALPTSPAGPGRAEPNSARAHHWLFHWQISIASKWWDLGRPGKPGSGALLICRPEPGPHPAVPCRAYPQPSMVLKLDPLPARRPGGSTNPADLA